jgi:hypothetical protein
MSGTVRNEGALQVLLAQSMDKTAMDMEFFWNRTGPLTLQVRHLQQAFLAPRKTCFGIRMGQHRTLLAGS